MGSSGIKRIFGWIVILVLGTVAITLSSYSLPLRYGYIG